MAPPNSQAVKTLHDTFWSPEGWRDAPDTEPRALADAIKAGVMFSRPVVFTHDELVESVINVVSETGLRDVSDAFLGSLTSRRLEQRSALGSYVFARHLMPHSFQGTASRMCKVCGVYDQPISIDRNVLNFERFKWGGVRRTDLEFVWHDLACFELSDVAAPTTDDRTLFDRLLAELERAPAELTAPKAAKSALKELKGNQAERGVVLEILGICSVLESVGHPGFRDSFINADARTLPPNRFVDFAYPACWWRGADGVNRDSASALGLL